MVNSKEENKNKNIVFISLKKEVSSNNWNIGIIGTGILLKNKKVITNNHVYKEILEEDREFLYASILGEDGVNYVDYKIEEEKIDEVNDIILLKISEPRINSNLIQDLDSSGFDKEFFMKEEDINKLEEGADLDYRGFPLATMFLKMNLGITFMVNYCNLGSKKYRKSESGESDKKLNFLLIDKAVNPGSSGSPVFVKKNNEDRICGIASGSFNNKQKIGESLINTPLNIGLVRPSNFILDLIKD